MKINNGYVTNSSSTSFVVCTKNGISKEKFLSAFGIHEDSLLKSFYEKLYYVIQKEKTEIPTGVNLKKYFQQHRIDIEDTADLSEIEKRYNSGEKVYYGKLEDCGAYGGMIEAFYALESVIVIGDDLYFNAKDCAY